MRDIFPDLTRWVERDEPIALATVIRTWGSSPRGVGAKMALTPGGKITGSVSGGCVEGAVAEAGTQVLKTGQPQLLHFGVADETAWQVGLACGGSIDVYVNRLDHDLFEILRMGMQEARPMVVATVVRGPDPLLGEQMVLTKEGKIYGSLSSPYENQVLAGAEAALAKGRAKSLRLERHGEEPVEIFADVLLPPPALVMVGGVHIAIALTSIARTLGYRSVIVDPRRAFGSPERFSHGDELIQAWPDEAFSRIELTENTAVVMLTHDPKIDDPALKIVLNSPVFYIGVLGSRNTHAKRRIRLLEAGISEPQLARLHAPIGLDIGGDTPEEIALAVMAEIVAARNAQNPQVESVPEQSPLRST